MSVTEQLYKHRLWWLGHILRMPYNRLHRQNLFGKPIISWKRPSDGQYLIWKKNLKSLTEGLHCVGNLMLAGWRPRDPSRLWLETLNDMASHGGSHAFSCPFVLKNLDYKLIFEFYLPISHVTLVMSCDVACIASRTIVFTLGSWLWNWNHQSELTLSMSFGAIEYSSCVWTRIWVIKTEKRVATIFWNIVNNSFD